MSIDRRWLVAGAGASLLLNVFLIGIVAGHTFGLTQSGKPGGGSGPGWVVPQGHVRALPKDERKLFNAGMAPHRDAIHAARREQQRLREAAEADIAAATFDREKVVADFNALRDASTTLQTHIHEGLVDALQALSPASRAALVAHEDASAGAAHPDHHETK